MTERLKLPRRITHRELRLGDCVNLEFANGGWQMAKVITINGALATLFRPHMSSADEYPYIGVEIFTVFRESDKTVMLHSRCGE
jgi:hypothetical protein